MWVNLKMHISIKNQVYNNYDNLIKQDKIETKKILINGKNDLFY